MKPQRRNRGFTVMEIVVASTLAALLAWVIVAALASTQRLAQVSIERGRMNSEVRQITDLAVKYLRSARPRGTCILPPGDVMLSSCTRPAETGPAVIFASHSEIWFYGYLAGAAQDPALRAPDCIQLAFTAAGQMTITRFRPGYYATYTNPVWGSAAEALRSIRAAGSATPLESFTSGGDPIAVSTPIGVRSCTLPPAPDARLSQIAMVKISARATSTRTGAGSVDLNVVAELPSIRFRSGS